jgi:chitin disaccharide deacetylase
MAQLYTRADDAGSSKAANRAIYSCITEGITRNVSVMAPTPETAHASQTLKGLDACFGFHVTLNAEWDEIKWKPLSPPERVPSLIDERGYFLPHPKELRNRFKIDEVLVEAKVQLEYLRRLGFPISYLDEHMTVGQVGLREALLDFAKKEKLIPVETLAYSPSVQPSGDLVKDLERLLGLLGGGSFIHVTHPAFADPELEPCFNSETPKGQVARERNAEREFLCNPEVKKFVETHKIEITRFDEMA